MDWTKCLLALVAFAIIAYKYLKRVHSHWKKQNVPFVPDPIPLFGHMLPTIIVKENIIDFVDRAYKNFNTSMVGFFFMQQPGIILRDPDLVKSVLQTNFSSFNSNVMSLSEKHDPVLAKNPFFTRDPHLWRPRRNKVSNNLTGKKLKLLSVIIQEVCNKMTVFVDRKIQENNGQYECELKAYFLRYTGEVVANSAFAIEGESFEDNPNKLSFTKVSKTLLQPSFINGLKQALIFYVPMVAEFFGLSFLDKRTDIYMRENIKTILKKRQQAGDAPNDYLKFCSEFNSELDDILAEIFNFYIDVYETSSTILANICHCLAQNQEIQAQLRDHITSALKDNEETISYDSLKNMNYLDQVVYEGLRQLPPLAVQMKYCNEAISLTGPDGLTCHLEPGNPVFIPVRRLHLDDKYWPNPNVFDPLRFSVENQANNNKYAFLAFGEGPRMCVGMRLGLLLVKHAIATLLLKYSIEPSAKTKVPLEIEPSSLLLSFKGGLWCKFKLQN
ncbi:cytochrome P450 6j1-like [Phymastichus coffea]|uniref:cytochrome P450 6j1-like n=1 Tax=Phymastichus coffea TaxID=108790 RepID=UPI00273CE793|nr:cytochrome P450 6j1-like [Phymastichus coffea]